MIKLKLNSFLRLSLLFIAFSIVYGNSNGQVIPGWKHTLKNSLNSINKARSIEIDKAKNCFVLGTTSIPDSAKDILLFKFNPQGVEEWRRIYDNPDHGDDIPVAMCLDVEGNILITGMSKDKTGNTDILILKYTTEGVPVIDLHFDGPAHGFDTPVAITIDRTRKCPCYRGRNFFRFRVEYGCIPHSSGW
ncbi:MAG: hypothetical protein IPP38_02370 [Bacteroidetes bacterium]|nr:hypothetical protein [Bacteroidota bacterium]